MPHVRILYYLKKINCGEIERPELREFIEICCRIAEDYLNKKHHKYKTIFSVNRIDFVDVAVDSITPLFITNDSLDLTGIRKALSKWHRGIPTEGDAAFFIHKLIWKNADQTVTHILSELDPVYGKLLKEIMIQAEYNGYRKIYYFGQSYLVEADNKHVKGTLITDEAFDEIPAEIFRYKINSAIKNLFEYLKDKTCCFPAIPLNNLVLRIKQLYINGMDFSESIQENHESLLFINQIFSESLLKANALIDQLYIAKNKLTPSEGDIFKKVLTDISIDLKNGGISRGMEDYLNPYFKELTTAELKEKYHNILDYLIRLLKKDLADALKHSGFS